MAKKPEFKAKNGSRINDTQAQYYGERLYKLMKEKNKKDIAPEDVVEDAKNEDTPYHDYFEWDDSKAARKHRLKQARDIMRSIVKIKTVKSQEKPVKVRAFHCVKNEDTGENGYSPEETVFKKPKLSEQVILRALKEAKSWNRRYNIYTELSEISQAIEKKLKEHPKIEA